ncbi:proline-rich protein 15-like [Micropterus salmoides]|uniref:proline-rich protein 15-like n=1 Tax=Micropterus salmoides TaxID=27706 RepID=UPI0018EB1F13|nr:proline-rich protein 15-like [Micropterus salmoides]
MTERSPWWKTFLPKWKSGSPKDTASPHTFGPDFDPFAQKQKGPTAAASKATGDQSVPSQQGTNSNLLSDETFDDAGLESVFNEQTCRRKMNVSRSGRFKEKRRVRTSLPREEKETENVAPGTEDKR